MFTHNFLNPPVLIKTTNEYGNRTYTTPEGNNYLSVTTYLDHLMDDSFLDRWEKRIGVEAAARISSLAKFRGQMIHKAIEAYLMNDLGYKDVLSSNIMTKSLFLKLRPELDKLNNIRLIETAIYSDKMQLAGTPDCIADYDGLLSTIDFKGSTKDKLDKWIVGYKLQTAIYSRMLKDQFGLEPQQSVILMAGEKNPAAAIFIEPNEIAQKNLQEFIDDPDAFQKKQER